MKRIVALFLSLTFCLSLAGCGTAPVPESQPVTEPPCPHQWSGADCVSADTCVLCGEVQSEALGHSWLDATCEEPEHCASCGETRGDALEHSYGNWLLDADFMYRTCASCGQSENAEIDYPLYLSQHAAGHWNLRATMRSNWTITSDRIPTSEGDLELKIYEDGRVVSRGAMEKEICSVWNFEHAEYIADRQQHVMHISFPEDTVFTDASFYCTDNSLSLEVTLEDGKTLILSKDHGEALSPLICGTWSALSGDSLYNITLSEDRTFTSDLDGGISGYWLPRAPYSMGGYSQAADIQLHYSKDETAQFLAVTLHNYDENRSREYLQDVLSLVFHSDDVYLDFSLDSAEVLTAAKAAAASAHLGSWTSYEYITSRTNLEDYKTEEKEGLSTAYSITFNEDGTFYANLHKQVAGRWEFSSVRLDYGVPTIRYNLSGQGINTVSYCQISDGKAYVYLNYERADAYESANYHFQRMTEEEIAARNTLVENAPAQLTGEWFSTDGAGSSATFHEDGTFTVCSGSGSNQTEQTGKWYFRTLYTGDDYINYYYDIETVLDMPGLSGTGSQTGAGSAITGALPALGTGSATEPEETEPFTIREDSALRLLLRDGQYSLEISSSFFHGTMTNAAGIAAKKDAAEKVIGHWSADVASQYDSKTKEQTEIPGSYSIDLSEDGTFSCHVGREFSGTWTYFENADGALHYLLTFADSSGLDTRFTLEDDVLTGFVNSHIIHFTR